MTLTDEMFPPMERGSSTIKPIATLCSTANQAAQVRTFHLMASQSIIDQLMYIETNQPLRSTARH
jgi:hypothetical protein